MEQLRRILVVDDDVHVGAVVCAVVRKLADEIVERVDGSPGVRVAIKHCPSLMLLDLSMPDMTGFEVLTAVKAELPVIVVSGSGTVDTAFEAMRHGLSVSDAPGSTVSSRSIASVPTVPDCATVNETTCAASSRRSFFGLLRNRPWRADECRSARPRFTLA
ncbi:MAG: response regulator [Myxococcales bacterium]|nr:MAG: response regulator [Myxococcales bacterium]